MYLSILLPSVFALFALWKKKVTKPGIIAAWLMGVIITYFGGLYAFGALALTFVLTISSDKIKRKLMMNAELYIRCLVMSYCRQSV